MKKTTVKITAMKAPKDFDEVVNPSAFTRPTVLEIGESVIGLFQGIEHFVLGDKDCFSLVLMKEDGKKIVMNIATGLRHLAALGISGKTWMRIERLEDFPPRKGQKISAKHFVFGTNGPVNSDEVVQEIFASNGWNKKLKKEKGGKNKY